MLSAQLGLPLAALAAEARALHRLGSAYLKDRPERPIGSSPGRPPLGAALSNAHSEVL